MTCGLAVNRVGLHLIVCNRANTISAEPRSCCLLLLLLCWLQVSDVGPVPQRLYAGQHNT
jgi:hypothetical protein